MARGKVNVSSGTGGNALASDLLASKTATVDSGQIVGTMPNFASQTIITDNHGSPMTVVVDPLDNRMGIITLPNMLGVVGKIDSSTKIQAQLWGLIPSAIASGYQVGQYNQYGTGYMTGTFTSDANANTFTILAGYSGYVNSVKVNGVMPNNGDQSATITTQGGSKVIPVGYTTGGTVTATYPDGTGLKRTASGSMFKSGDTSRTPQSYSVTGLAFTPRIIIVSCLECRQAYIQGGDTSANNRIYCASDNTLDISYTLTVTASGFSGAMRTISGGANITWTAEE